MHKNIHKIMNFSKISSIEMTGRIARRNECMHLAIACKVENTVAILLS